MRRIAVTGVGNVSPIGNDAESAWKSLMAGKGGIGKITRFDASDLACQIAGEVKDFDATKYIPAAELRRNDLFIVYGVCAAMEAIADAGLDDDATLDKRRVGVVIGSGIGGLPAIERNVLIAAERPRRVSPFFIPSAIGNMISGYLSIAKGYQGPSYGSVSACTTGTHCVGDAMDLIRSGRVDVAVAGGAEATICKIGVAGFSACRALSTRNDDPATASRPFDKGRDGFVMGEGSGVMVLEELERAKKRGAKIYAELVGYGFSSDAHHITAPLSDGSGAAMGMEAALRDARISPEQVQYVNAHGTSTPLGDAAESTAIKRVFGDKPKLVVNSTKSFTGHLLGGAGGVEAVYTVLAVKNQVSPPTINIFDQDFERGCDLDYCANEARPMKIDYAISNSFGFGGTNGTVVFKRFEG